MRLEGMQRKKENDTLGTRVEEGFRKEENERKKFQDELAPMKDEMKAIRMGSNCTVSSAANTGFSLGSGTFVGPPSQAHKEA